MRSKAIVFVMFLNSILTSTAVVAGEAPLEFEEGQCGCYKSDPDFCYEVLSIVNWKGRIAIVFSSADLATVVDGKIVYQPQTPTIKNIEEMVPRKRQGELECGESE